MPAATPMPMLAKLATTLPSGSAWRYEPKLDGFRGLLARDCNGRISLASRNGKDLLPCFPELGHAGTAVPDGTILDGEIVIANEAGMADFGALQDRLVRSTRQPSAMASACAALLVFDLLMLDGRELLDLPLRDRRRHLESLLPNMHPCLQLVEQTASIEAARDWLAYLPSLEGVVAKRVDERYRPGFRGWIKVKRQRTADCIVVGFAGDARNPALVLALSDAAGRLRMFGATRPIPESLAEPIQNLLARAGPSRAPIPSRWQHDQVPTWRPVPPELVCEVRFSNVDRRRWIRFPATLLRWRPDRSAGECTLEQLSSG